MGARHQRHIAQCPTALRFGIAAVGFCHAGGIAFGHRPLDAATLIEGFVHGLRGKVHRVVALVEPRRMRHRQHPHAVARSLSPSLCQAQLHLLTIEFATEPIDQRQCRFTQAALGQQREQGVQQFVAFRRMLLPAGEFTLIQ